MNTTGTGRLVIFGPLIDERTWQTDDQTNLFVFPWCWCKLSTASNAQLVKSAHPDEQVVPTWCSFNSELPVGLFHLFQI